MWIFLSIVLFLGLVITAVLLLPVYVIVKADQSGELQLRYKILHKTFGEEPDPNNPIVRTLKSASGVSRLEKQNIKTNIQKNDFISTLRESFSLIVDLLREIVGLLRYCKIKVLKLNIICADADAADAAMSYGECCAVVYPLLGYLHSFVDVKPSGEDVRILCDYDGDEGSWSFETVLTVRVWRVLVALWRTVLAESKRMAEQQAQTDANSHKNRG